MNANTLETNDIVIHRPSYPRLGAGRITKIAADGIVTASFWIGWLHTETGAADDFERIDQPDSAAQVNEWINE